MKCKSLRFVWKINVYNLPYILLRIKYTMDHIIKALLYCISVTRSFGFNFIENKKMYFLIT